MPDIRLVLTDMDGTVVSTLKHEASLAVREVIIAAENQGVTVAAVTARPYELAKSALTVLGIEGLCVIDGGATIINPVTDEIIWKRWLDASTVRKAATVLVSKAITVDYFPEHKQVPAAEADIEIVNWGAPYVYGTFAHVDIEDIRRQIEAIPDVISHLINLYDDTIIGLQITHAQADKSHGVSKLCDLLSVAKEHTLGIGDGDNDLPLFQNAGLKIAMGNATDGLKAQADHVVSTLEEDGFAEAMERFVLTS